jgi:YfiH family protein
MEWRETGGLRWLEARLEAGTAAFTTRIGGVSAAPFDGLNLGVFTEDERESVVENRRRLAAALGFSPERVAIGHQVHGAELERHGGPQHPSPFSDPDSPIPAVDGHVTAEPSLPLLVFVADCVPVALSGPGGVAMLHCGWRGLASGIVAEGADAVGATEAAIGPSIGPCCYEVGEEVLATFAGLGEGVARGRMLDLPEVVRRLLREAGVGGIESSGLCTSCEADLFYSHRRDAGRTGRQAGLVWRDGESG